MPGSDCVYWDSCILLAWLKDKKDRKPGEMAGVREYVNRIKRREVHMMTSALTYAEILGGKLPVGVYQLFDDLMKRNSITRLSVDMRIAKLAEDLREHYVAIRSQNNDRILSVPDAIHLATAILYKADEFHTCDEENRKRTLGLIPLNGNVAGHSLLYL